jgi:hypothetical protein
MAVKPAGDSWAGLCARHFDALVNDYVGGGDRDDGLWLRRFSPDVAQQTEDRSVLRRRGDWLPVCHSCALWLLQRFEATDQPGVLVDGFEQFLCKLDCQCRLFRAYMLPPDSGGASHARSIFPDSQSSCLDGAPKLPEVPDQHELGSDFNGTEGLRHAHFECGKCEHVVPPSVKTDPMKSAIAGWLFSADLRTPY